MELHRRAGVRRYGWLVLLSLLLAATSAHAFLNPPADSGNPSFYLPSETGGIAHFMGSANCGSCHDSTVAQCGYVNSPTPCTGNGSPLAYIDNNGHDVSIRESWSATMMGNSARDPFWRAKVKRELGRHPGLSAEINDKCTVCHAPMANADAKAAGTAVSIFDDLTTGEPGLLSTGNARHDQALDGVSCSLCHQIKNDPTLGTLEGYTGGYKIDMTLSGSSRIMYGPYSNNLFAGPMRNNQAFGGAIRSNPVYSEHISKSELCGTCHDLKTPTVDENGAIITTTPESEFPEQMPYSEWKNSAFNFGPNPISCQQCHMARTDGVYISTQPAATLTTSLVKRDNFAIHEFVGGNKFMLDIFDKNKTQLGVLSNNFAATLAATDTILHGAANLETQASGGAKNTLEFTLKVNSETGHKLPSAYPSRRAFLHVQVKNPGGQVVWESGRPNADGSIAGVDADTTPGAYEPHYDLITSQGQVQVYESIMGDNQGNVTYTLLRGAAYLKDNRIPPAGFDKTIVPDDVKVAGDALSDANFVGGSDEVTYRIAGLAPGNYTVTATLLYQTLAYGFAQDLFGDTVTNEVADFKTLYEGSGEKTQTIASLEWAEAVKRLGDVDGDGDVDNSDIASILAAKNTAASGVTDARDINGDLSIDVLDSRKAALLCTRPRCAVQ